MPTAACRSLRQGRANISGSRRRGNAPGITRRVRLAKNVNGIAGLQVAACESRIGVQREIADRERADAVESPYCETLHRFDRRSMTSEVSGRDKRPRF